MMNNKKRYPSLHKSLSRGLGARGSVKILKLVEDERLKNTNLVWDADLLASAFTWHMTERGFEFWLTVARKCYGYGNETHGFR